MTEQAEPTARQRLITAMTDSDTCFCGADSCQNAEQYVDAYAHQLAEQQRAAIKETDDPVFYAGEAGWLADLIDPETQR
jgi:hypothetical protein